MLVRYSVVAVTAIVFSLVESSKILGIFWTPSRSHHIAASPLMRELSTQGHEVDLLSSFVDKNVNIPSYKQVLLTGIIEEFNNSMSPNETVMKVISEFIPKNRRVVDKFWMNKPIQNLIKNKPKYDAVFILSFFNDYIISVGNILETPVILFSTMGTNVINNKFLANPNLPYGRNTLLESSTDSFVGRLATATFNAIFYIVFKYLMFPIQLNTSRKYLPNMPAIEELHKNVSLVLVNIHFALEAPRPYVPNMIQVGGYHLQGVKKLPEDLGKFLDSAEDGAILFSMGSNVKIAENFKKEQLDLIMNGLAKVAPIRVVFKSEVEIPLASGNILVSKWLPQNDILAHPNMKLFISHCGLGGMTEAVFHGVPILGIPFFADQNNNAVFAAESGFAIKLKKDDLTQEAFDGALDELLNNPKYTTNVKKRSSILRNQPVKPMDNAIWWIEHIIEHKGAEHLRNAGMDLEWYQLYMVDIMLFYLLVASISLTVSFFVSRWILRKLCRCFGVCGSDKKKSRKKKTN